jgi:hypothetical protein
LVQLGVDPVELGRGISGHGVSHGLDSDGATAVSNREEVLSLLIVELVDVGSGDPAGVWQAGIDGPGGCGPVAPLSLQVLSGLMAVVGDDPGGGGLPSSAHGDVGEFAAAAVGQEMGAVDGGALDPVRGGGVAVIDLVGP